MVAIYVHQVQFFDTGKQVGQNVIKIAVYKLNVAALIFYGKPAGIVIQRFAAFDAYDPAAGIGFGQVERVEAQRGS